MLIAMKLATVLFLFAVSSYAETIIIPVRGDFVYGLDGSYVTTVEVTNIDVRPVSARVREIFPTQGNDPCTSSGAVIIQPLETAEVPTGCSGLYGYTLEADGRVRVDAEVRTTRPVPLPTGYTSSSNWQQIKTARAWLPADRLAIIPRVWIGEPNRTNVFVLNPNDHPINFELNTTRRSPSAPTHSTVHLIAAKSLSTISPSPIDDSVCRLPLVCEGTYKLTFRADGPYYAVASSIMLLSDAISGSPTVVEDQP